MNQQLTIEEVTQEMEIEKKKQQQVDFTFNKSGQVLPWEQKDYDRQK